MQRVALARAPGGGCVEDVSRRLSSLERDVSAIKMELTAALPYLTTRADIVDVKSSIIQWMVSGIVATAWIVFANVRFVH